MQYNRGTFLSSIMPVTKHLLIVNIIMWLASVVFQYTQTVDLYRWLGLHFWQLPEFNPFQFFTYMFMHDNSGIAHIFFNMFSLWMFGSLLEKVLGSKRYLFYYISCGLGAALVQQLVWQITMEGVFIPTVGASGAVFGILLAFGMLFPNMKMYIIPFPFPVKAKWVVLGYGLLELYFGISGRMSGVAHFAHLGGMIAGIIMILYWKHKGTLTRGNGFY